MVPKSEDPLVVALGHLSFEVSGPEWPPKISTVNEAYVSLCKCH